MGFPGGSVIKNLLVNACNTGGMHSVPGSGKHPGEGFGDPLQYSCLGNPMNRGAWWARVHGVAKSWTLLVAKPLPLSACQSSDVYPSHEE